jgi:catechol 2,3-dioxygenase-like lactoylglutathione lyase family enzyme
MFRDTKAFSGFSVTDLAAAKEFYGQTLGLEVEEASGALQLKIAGRNPIYDKAVDELAAKGIKFEHYDNMTDEKGIARGRSQNMGPDIAWFTDPAGNILSVLNEG